MLIFAAIFFPTDYYKNGQEAYASGNYELAVSDFSRVEPDDEHYQEAQSMIAKANQKIEEEKARQEAIVQTSYFEVRKNVFPIVKDNDQYTVLLHDMTLDEQPNDTTFAHKYRILVEDGTGMPRDTITDWMAVSDTTFDYYINDQGMELMAENSGETNIHSSPPGYNRYVGNPTYGSWQNDSNGDSFWKFYGQYAFLTNVFGYTMPVYQYSYHDYTDYYRGRTAYYGPPSGSGYQFGTGSANAQTQNPRSFSQKVQSRVNRSSSKFTARSTFRSNVNNSMTRSSARISRASSRSSSVRSGSTSRGGK